VGSRPKVDPLALAPSATSATASPDVRPAFFDGAWHDTPVYQRLDLPVGWSGAGPAIFEQPDATIVVEPAYVASVDKFGNLLVEAAT
jgi:N-methylhydantoinase A